VHVKSSFSTALMIDRYERIYHWCVESRIADVGRRIARNGVTACVE
jgi:hypothetical protein